MLKVRKDVTTEKDPFPDASNTRKGKTAQIALMKIHSLKINPAPCAHDTCPAAGYPPWCYCKCFYAAIRLLGSAWNNPKNLLCTCLLLNLKHAAPSGVKACLITPILSTIWNLIFTFYLSSEWSALMGWCLHETFYFFLFDECVQMSCWICVLNSCYTAIVNCRQQLLNDYLQLFHSLFGIRVKNLSWTLCFYGVLFFPPTLLGWILTWKDALWDVSTR